MADTTAKLHPNDVQFRQTRAAAEHMDEPALPVTAELTQPAPQSLERKNSMSITGIGGTGATIKQLLEDHKQQMTNLIEGHVTELKDTLTKQRSAVGAFGRMVVTASKETDDFLADLGQFTNDLGL